LLVVEIDPPANPGDRCQVLTPGKEIYVLAQRTSRGHQRQHLLCCERRKGAQDINRDDGAIAVCIQHDSLDIIPAGQAQDGIKDEAAHAFAHLVMTHISSHIIFELLEHIRGSGLLLNRSAFFEAGITTRL